MQENILTIKDLYVVYETDEATVYAVNGLDLEIKQGETLGLVGETGAGKTTTALSIMKLLPEKIGFVKKGTIDIAGVDPINLAERGMREVRGSVVSMIFQDPMTSLNPTITVGEQISEVIAEHNPDYSDIDIADRTNEIMEMVGLAPERKKEYPHQFSGGMRQRVVIAMALACEPSLILADEPTTALDVTIQAQVLDMMKSLKDKLNTSILLITHDLGVVADICDHVAIMYSGRVVEYGTLEDIYTGDKHHPYTEGLFGSIPKLNEETDRLTPIKGLMPDPTNLPKGCPFHPRCQYCLDICSEIEPEAFYVSGEDLSGKGENHMIRCHLFDENLEAKVRQDAEKESHPQS